MIKHYPWSPDDKAILHKLWGRETMAAIAKKLGRTRNAVAGMAYRMGLPRLHKGNCAKRGISKWGR